MVQGAHYNLHDNNQFRPQGKNRENNSEAQNYTVHSIVPEEWGAVQGVDAKLGFIYKGLEGSNSVSTRQC